MLQFDFSEEVDCEGPAPVDIPLDEIDGGVVPGETVTIAARAVVEGEGPDGTHPRCLLGDKCVAWGEGPRSARASPRCTSPTRCRRPACGASVECVFDQS